MFFFLSSGAGGGGGGGDSAHYFASVTSVTLSLGGQIVYPKMSPLRSATRRDDVI